MRKWVEIMDHYLEKLSSILVHHSLRLKKGERVLINYQNTECNRLVKRLINDIFEVGAIPFVRLIDGRIASLLLEGTNDERISEIVKHNVFDVNNFDCFINIRYSENDYENKFVDPKIRNKLGSATKEIDDIRINKRRWVLLNYPSITDAYKASMPSDKFALEAFKIMTFDYSSMEEAFKPLKELMEKTDKVRIVGSDTDLSFSIKDIPVIPCTGRSNIPDGEIFTAPIKDSINGKITFNTKCPYHGNIYTGVTLNFKDGCIVEATCNEDNESLNEIFDTDEGSRYVGEFAIGLNPLVKKPMGDILYDEKIIGSIHFTPGRAYKEAYNDNESAIHWDMVLIQTKEYGGGELYFDDVLVRKDGIFVLDELKHLNYDLK